MCQRIAFNAPVTNYGFLGDLKHFANKSYPEATQNIHKHIVFRRFLEEKNHSQVRLDLRKISEDENTTVKKALGKVLYLDAIKRIKEEVQVPLFAAIRHDEPTKSLVEEVNFLVQILSGTSDSKSKKDHDIGQGCINSRRGYLGQKHFNQNQGRHNSVENERKYSPIMIKT